MTAKTVAFIGALIYEHQDLLSVLEEHLEDNDGEVLPHLIMADVVRWLVAHRADQADLSRRVFAWLESAYERGDEDERDVIAVSGVEMLPDPGDEGADLRRLLGPQLRSVDPWREA